MPTNEIHPEPPIAVTFALPDESRDFVAKLSDVRTLSGGPLPVITGALGGQPLVVCHTGVGEQSCRARIAPFLQQHHPRFLVASGFAGGLDPVLKVGDVIIAENFSDPASIPAVEGASRVAMTSQASVAETIAAKAALFAQTRAQAIDMETAIIFAECAERGIPMLSLRAISDAAGDDLPISSSIWFDMVKQKPRVAALLWHLATHPAKIGPFARFVRGITFTRGRLTAALVAAVTALARPKN